MTLRLKVGHEQNKLLATYEALSTVVSQALGGGEKNKEADVVYTPKTVDEAEMMLRKVLGD